MFRAQKCSKHVEVFNKLIKETRICEFNWSITRIILRCTVKKHQNLRINYIKIWALTYIMHQHLYENDVIL